MLYQKLRSGAQIPMVGIGTWTLRGDACYDAVRKALDIGYTHIDTAEVYGNQKEVGKAIADSKVDRKTLFVTSKVWRENLTTEGVLKACDRTLDELGLDYLDLYLIHWPNRSIPMEDTFRGLTKLVEAGKVRDIGVSNFSITNLRKAIQVSETPISMNQVEFHPYLNQKELLKECQDNGVVVTAYSSLGRGSFFSDEKLVAIARKAGVGVAQMILKWLISKGIVVIPRSSSVEHLKDNLNVFDVELTDEVLAELESIKERRRLINPDFAEFDD